MSHPLADAVKVLRQRHHFDDVGEALALLGFAIRAKPDVVDASPRPAPDLEHGMWLDEAAEDTSAIGAFEEQLDGEYSSELVAGFLLPDPGDAGTDDDSGVDLVPPTRSGPVGRPAGPTPALLAREDRVVCSILEPTTAPRTSAPTYDPVPWRPVEEPTDRPTVLDPMTVAATLYSLTKAPRSTSEPDLDRAMERLVLGEPLDRLSTVRVPAAPERLLVLVDQKLRVGPCAEDVDRVLEGLRSVLGRSVVSEWGFTDDQVLTCGIGPVWRWRPLAEHDVRGSVLFVTGGELGRSRYGRLHLDIGVAALHRSDVVVSALLFAPDLDSAPRSYPCWIVRD